MMERERASPSRWMAGAALLALCGCVAIVAALQARPAQPRATPPLSKGGSVAPQASKKGTARGQAEQLVALAPAPALQGLERHLVKEPKYKSSPGYCLVAFGEDAATRVWVVQDGDVLYVDRNGNGDLTEEGERLVANKKEADAPQGAKTGYDFGPVDIADGSLVHKLRVAIESIDHIAPHVDVVKTFLAAHPKALGVAMICEVEVPGKQGGGLDGRIEQMALFFDLNGVLQFAPGPEEAPVIHFGGPLEASFYGRHELKVGRQKEIVLAVGTPGLGPGTTAFIGYNRLIPQELHPRVEIVYPPEREGAPAVRESYEIATRCCGANFMQLVRVPANIGAGMAEVTIRFDSWTAGRVTATRHQVAVTVPPPSPFALVDVSPRLKSMLQHPNRFSSMTNGMRFSPDGKQFIAGDYDGGIIQVWDVDSGRPLAKIDTGKRNNHYDFVVSPDWKTVYELHEVREAKKLEKDGKRIVRVEFDGGVRAWNLETGELRKTYQHTPPRGIHGMTMSPDGSLLITNEQLPGDKPRDLKPATSVLDLATGVFREIAGGGTFSPDSRLIAIDDRDRDNFSTSINLVDVTTGEQQRSIPIAEKATRISSLQFTPDGALLVTAEHVFTTKDSKKGERFLKFRDAASDAERASIPELEESIFGGPQISPDGALLAVKSGPSKLLLYDIRRAALAHTVELPAKETIRAPVFSPDGKWVALLGQIVPPPSASEEMNSEEFSQPRIYLVETATGTIRETIVGPQEFALEICFSPDSKTLAMSGIGRILLWDLERPSGPEATSP